MPNFVSQLYIHTHVHFHTMSTEMRNFDCTITMLVNPAYAPFQRKRAQSTVNGLSLNISQKPPRPQIKRAPPSSVWGERPGAELASRLNEGNRAVSEAGKM